MTDHVHDLDDPRMCMECAPSQVTAAKVRAALDVLGADTTRSTGCSPHSTKGSA